MTRRSLGWARCRKRATFSTLSLGYENRRVVHGSPHAFAYMWRKTSKNCRAGHISGQFPKLRNRYDRSMLRRFVPSVRVAKRGFFPSVLLIWQSPTETNKGRYAITRRGQHGGDSGPTHTTTWLYRGRWCSGHQKSDGSYAWRSGGSGGLYRFGKTGH